MHCELQLFTINVDAKSVTHLAALVVPPGLTRVDLRGTHLALLCQTVARVTRIFSFQLELGPEISIVPGPAIRVSSKVCPSFHVAHTWLTIK